MNESEFNALVDDTLLSIEETLDEAESDLDYSNAGGVLTVICESGSQVIFTRQAPVSQLWVATPGGGFHFDYDGADKCWKRDSDGEPLARFLTATFGELADESFRFSC